MCCVALLTCCVALLTALTSAVFLSVWGAWGVVVYWSGQLVGDWLCAGDWCVIVGCGVDCSGLGSMLWWSGC